MSCALNILADGARDASEERAATIIAQCLGEDIVEDARACAREELVNLRTMGARYDLAVAPFIVDDGMIQRYFTALSDSMIDTQMCQLGAKFVMRASRVTNFVVCVRESATGRAAVSGCFSTGGRPLRATRSDTPGHCSSEGTGRSARPVKKVARQCVDISTSIRACAAQCIDSQTGTYNFTVFDDLFANFMASISHATRAIDAITPIKRADTSVDAKCPRCHTFMRSLEPCVMVCDKCGRVADISVVQSGSRYNMASDSDIAPMSDDVRTVSRRNGSGCNFVRHMRKWLDKLQAIESFAVPKADLEKIRRSIARESLGMACRITESCSGSVSKVRGAITCADVTRALKNCDLDNLSEHIPKIVKLLGGRAPPVLQYSAEQVIARDFSHIMDVYVSNSIGSVGNKPYYPFFIAKIVKRRFARGTEPRRLVDFISSQGRETVCKNDEIYRMICEKAPPQYDLVYEPEDV
jgi:hypothetical protein